MANTARSILALVLIGTSALATQPACALAQVRTPYPEELPPVEEILSNFECESVGSDCEELGSDQIVWVHHHPDEAPPGVLEGLLDGLQRMALEGRTEDIRQSAALRLAAFGAERTYNPDPLRGVLTRLLTIYQQSSNRMVRYSILNSLSYNVERDGAVKFLTLVARQDSTNEDFQGSATAAVRALHNAGEPGRYALESLRTADQVKDPEAQILLEALRQ